MDGLSDDEKRSHIKYFLRDFKNLIYSGRLMIADRMKNRDALIDLGLTESQRVEELLRLSIEDYCSGPKKDEYHPGDCWIFGIDINGVQVFIRLKIGGSFASETAVCYSFHRAEGPMIHPLVNT